MSMHALTCQMEFSESHTAGIRVAWHNFLLANLALRLFFQVEFQDGTQLVLCSATSQVRYRESSGGVQQHALANLPRDPQLLKRLKYTRELLPQLTRS